MTYEYFPKCKTCGFLGAGFSLIHAKLANLVCAQCGGTNFKWFRRKKRFGEGRIT